MGQVQTIESNEAADLFTCVIQQRVPAIMTYMSRNKWHVAKVVLVAQSNATLSLETMACECRQQPLNVRRGQPVGLSFKHAYAKFVFDTTIMDLGPGANRGGTIVVARPERLEAVERRSYFRVEVPTGMQVKVVLWHRTGRLRARAQTPPCETGQLLDLSAGGAMVALPLPESAAAPNPERPVFHQGQFIGLRFTPLPYETPLVVNAQIRTLLPTADGQAVCLGLQLVGLEASREGQQTLARIAHVVDCYQQIQEGADWTDLAGAEAPTDRVDG